MKIISHAEHQAGARLGFGVMKWTGLALLTTIAGHLVGNYFFAEELDGYQYNMIATEVGLAAIVGAGLSHVLWSENHCEVMNRV